MARLYANENFPLAGVEALRQLGHDCLTSSQAGNSNQGISDDRVLAFAIADQRALLTVNRLHFIRLHGVQPSHFGIIVCTFDSDFVAQAQRIHAAIAAVPDLRGQLLRVNRPG
jgi:hypothetical protein